jgi:hypothetical protein
MKRTASWRTAGERPERASRENETEPRKRRSAPSVAEIPRRHAAQGAPDPTRRVQAARLAKGPFLRTSKAGYVREMALFRAHFGFFVTCGLVAGCTSILGHFDVGEASDAGADIPDADIPDAAGNDGRTADAANGTKLVVTVEGEGLGRVTAPGPSGIRCGAFCNASCEASFAEPTLDLELSASPVGESVFAGWSGGGCDGPLPTCRVRGAGSVNVTARFAVRRSPSYTLAVGTRGTTAGRVNFGNNFKCDPPECIGTFNAGSIIQLTASPPTDFLRWEGPSCSGARTPCEVTMNKPSAVCAIFK